MCETTVIRNLEKKKKKRTKERDAVLKKLNNAPVSPRSIEPSTHSSAHAAFVLCLMVVRRFSL